jgi:PadR family transcriptional regulator PadR
VATEKLELLVLRTLALAPLHGYGIGQRIEQVSGGVFKVTLGALYPALQRLERAGLVKGDWATTENGRRARYYAITAAGRRRLSADQAAWERTATAMMRILHADRE